MFSAQLSMNYLSITIDKNVNNTSRHIRQIYEGGDEMDINEELEQWMTDYGTSLLRMSFLYVKDLQAAEDIVQETFLKAYLHYEQFRSEASVKTWLTRIAINLCKDYRKSTWFQKVDCKEILNDLIGSANQTEDTIEQTLKNQELLTVIMELPRIYREVVLLCYYQEFTVHEAAAILGIAEATIFTRLRRARNKLRKRLEGWDYDEKNHRQQLNERTI